MEWQQILITVVFCSLFLCGSCFLFCFYSCLYFRLYRSIQNLILMIAFHRFWKPELEEKKHVDYKIIRFETGNGDTGKLICLECHSSKSVVIHFHENGSTIEEGYERAGILKLALKKSIVIVEYPGYMESRRYISEDMIMDHAYGAVEWILKKFQNFDTKKLYIIGQSIGCGVAITLAKRYNCAGLILQSPYKSLIKVMYDYNCLFGIFLIFIDSFDAENISKEISCPTLVLAGIFDDLIDARQSADIYKNIKTKEKHLDIGDHGHVFDAIEFSLCCKRFIKRNKIYA